MAVHTYAPAQAPVFAGDGQKLVLSPPVWFEQPLMGELLKEGEVMRLAQGLPGRGGKVGNTQPPSLTP